MPCLLWFCVFLASKTKAITNDDNDEKNIEIRMKNAPRIALNRERDRAKEGQRVRENPCLRRSDNTNKTTNETQRKEYSILNSNSIFIDLNRFVYFSLWKIHICFIHAHILQLCRALSYVLFSSLLFHEENFIVCLFRSFLFRENYNHLNNEEQ